VGGAIGRERVEGIARLAELGLARIHSNFAEAADSDEPIRSFARTAERLASSCSDGGIGASKGRARDDRLDR
jgi:hypothetical protein